MNILQFIPLDKSLMIRYAFLDLIGGKKDVYNYLTIEKNLSDDLISVIRVFDQWKTGEPLDVGESGTLYRFLKFYFWKKGDNREIIKRGTLKNREISKDPNIINLSLEKILKVDDTSQWLSASLLNDYYDKPIEDILEKFEKIIDPPEKAKLTVKVLKSYNIRREYNYACAAELDETIRKQVMAYVGYLKTGKMDFFPKHSEDYPVAKAYNLMSEEDAIKRGWKSLAKHESNRFKEMEKVIKQAENGEKIDSKDHRPVIAISMAKNLGREHFVYPNCINKSFPLWWDCRKYCSKL